MEKFDSKQHAQDIMKSGETYIGSLAFASHEELCERLAMLEQLLERDLIVRVDAQYGYHACLIGIW